MAAFRHYANGRGEAIVRRKSYPLSILFQKKSEQTSNKDIQLARKRYKDLMGEQM